VTIPDIQELASHQNGDSIDPQLAQSINEFDSAISSTSRRGSSMTTALACTDEANTRPTVKPKLKP